MKQKLHQTLGSTGRLPGNPILKMVGKALFLFFTMVLSAGTEAAAQGCTEPTITATTSATICGFGTATVTATASAGTVNWYTTSTGGTSAQSGTTLNRFMPPGSSSVTYYVGATDGSCTTTTRTAVTISVYEKPTISATASPSPACVGNVLSLSASATGGASPYSYSWSGPDGFTVSASTTATASTSPLTIDGAGFYNLSVTDANGCTAISGTNVSVYTNPVLDVVATPNPVCTGNTLFLTSGYNSGGSGVATYVWTGPNGFTATGANPTHNNATSSSAGVYSVTATDSRGCIGRGNTSTVSVISNSVTLTVTGSTNICSGAPTTLTSTGGSTYDWNPGTALSHTSGASVTASPTSTITYTVTGRVGNCYNTATVAVIVLAEYVVTASTTSTNGTISEAGTTNVCSGTDKTYTITPASGYHIADVQVDGTSIGNVPPFVIRNVTGPHTITADFAPNCTAPTISCTGNVTQSAGSGACNATVTYSAATATGTSPSITYSQNSGTTFSVGVTTVTATATNSCGTASCTFNVSVTPNTLGVSISPTNVSCYGGNNGAIATTVTGGSGSYSYSWTGGASGANPTGLAAGTYTVTVTDNGCSAVSPVSTTVTITQPSALSASSSVTNVLCNGGTTGAVSVSATGGTGTISGTGSFTGLSAGEYSYTVTDANGCTATTSGSITEPSALSASSSVTNVLCNGGTTGAVSVSATGGTGTISGTGSFTGLSAGAYSYTVTDANGCTATTSGSITEPSALSASSSVTNVLCNGGTTGAVSVSATGGTGTITGTGSFTGLGAGSYSYTVTDANGCTATTSGSITQPSSLSASSSVTNVLCNGGTTGAVSVTATGGTGTISGTGSFTGLGAGSYSYTVTDANGCTATTSGSITQPSSLSASSSVTNVLCNGGTTGAVSVTATGGTGTVSGTGSFTGLGAGSYSYTVTDANGCTASTSGSITEPSALSASSSVTNVLCNGGTTGAVSVTATGGTGTVSGTGSFTGLSAGSFSYTVTDANGCTATTSGNITQPSAISISSTATNISCHSSNGGNHSDGSVATTVSGGTGSYSYAWSGGANGANPSGLAVGTYSVTVTDANSCTATTSATVSQPSVLSATLTPTNVSCGSTSNGSVAASVSGGTSGYTYLWSNSQTNATNTGLTAATYSVTVTDAHSCTTTGSATVSSGSGITCSITGSTSVLGAVATTYTGPSGMTSYSWSVTGGDHVCDAHCHHHGSHSCGSGCDHHSQSCASGCHHHSGHSCSNSHHGDHHCNSHCHHHSSHSCGSNCDHHGHSCSSGCHHHSSHHCNHQHCSSPTISGSSTGSSVIINSPCSATAYSVTLTVTNSTSCSATSTSEVTVTPSATITVYSTLYTTGSGHRPSTTKSVLATNLKVFTRSTSRRRSGNQSNYSGIWNSTTGQVTNVSISSPASVNIGGGAAYRYTITVPANGRYLVVGQSVVSSTRCGGTTCTLYTGKKVGGQDDCDGDQHGRDDDDDDDVAPCSNTKVRFHSILKDQSGRCRELDTHEERGSLMMVVTPMELDFEDSVSYLPVIYESVEGEWNVSVSAEPPYGFYTEPSGELSTSVTDSVMNTLQFAVIDTGSEWTFTQLTHQIKHKGEDRVARSKPIMVNERTNKPVELNLSPNPADDNIRITMPKFEGRATIYIYNMAGQQVAWQPIEIISGFSVPMDISALAPGVYMVTAENTNGKASTRLIKSEK